MRVVTPLLLLRSFKIFFNLNCVLGSMLANGSSSNNSSGLCSKQEATPTLDWFPFDKSRMYLPFLSISPLKNSVKPAKNSSVLAWLFSLRPAYEIKIFFRCKVIYQKSFVQVRWQCSVSIFRRRLRFHRSKLLPRSPA